MKTAIDILREAVERTDVRTRALFGATDAFIRFESGQSAYIENTVTKLGLSQSFDPFPLVAVFTEGMTETVGTDFVEFSVPKIAIVIRTRDANATEQQKLYDSFAMVLHPIYEEFARQLASVNHSYELKVTRTDTTCYSDKGEQATSRNDLCDAVIIRNLSMKVLKEPNC